MPAPSNWRSDLAKELATHGHDAGLHPSGVVVFYNGIVWRIAGGDAVRPSLMALPNARARDVEWLAQHERKDRLK